MIAKIAEIPIEVAKTIVQYRKREAKIQDLSEIRNLPNVSESLFQKICKTFRVIKATAKSSVTQKVSIRKQKAEDLSSRKKNNVISQVQNPCVACSCEPSQQFKPCLPVIAVSPNNSRNNMKTFTPCSVRKSLSGAHIVAIYELAQGTQPNQTDTSASDPTSNSKDDKANFSTKVAAPASCQSVKKVDEKKLKKKGTHPSFDSEKVSSIEKWLNTVPSQFDRKRVDYRNMHEKKHEAVPNLRAPSTSNNKRSILASQGSKRHQREESAVPGPSKATRRALYMDSRDFTKHQRSKSKTQGDHLLLYSAERNQRREKSRENRMSPRKRHRTPRAEKKRRRHLAGDDIHRHRRYSRRKSLRPGEDQDANEGFTCILL